MRAFILVFLFGLIAISIGCDRLPNILSGGSIDERTPPLTVLSLSTANLKKRKFYSSISKSATVAGEVTNELSFVAPDGFAVKTTMPGAVTDAVIIGDEVFTRVNAGKWTKDNGESGLSAETLMSGFDFGNRDDVRNAEFGGRELLDGRDVFVYHFQTSKPYPMSQKVWVEVRSVLPVKSYTLGDFGGMKFETSTVYDYEKAVTVDRPEVFQ